MPKVAVENPESFQVQNTLNAWSHTPPTTIEGEAIPGFQGGYTILNPESHRRIHDTVLNIVEIGFTFEKLVMTGTLGFVRSEKTEVDELAQYETQALLILAPDPSKIPSNLEGETWVLQVLKFEDLDKYVAIARALESWFKRNILVTPVSAIDSEPDKTSGLSEKYNPVVPRFPKIDIRKTTPLE